MNPSNAPSQLYDAPFLGTDPGDGEAIIIREHGVVVPLDIAASAAETNTLANPDRAGVIATLVARTVGSGGARVVTFAAAFGQGAGLTLSFANEGAYAVMQSMAIGDGTYRWRVISSEAVGGNQATRQSISVQCLLNADCVDRAFFVADRPYRVVRIDEVHATAGNDGGAVNLQVTKDSGTDAPGAGDDLLTNNSDAGFNMKGTANTVQNGTLDADHVVLAVGDRLSLDFAGTVTTLAGVVVTVTYEPI